jgi:predicted ribosome quality control (RQC) complex YloA/Tae2 family protein
MDNFLLQAIVTELEPVLSGRRLGKINQFGATDLLIDFHLRDGRWLAVSTDPQRLALYLTARSPKQFNENPRSDTAFVALLKKHLSGARLVAIEKLGYDRVVKFEFIAGGEEEQARQLSMVVLLTGRTANVLLVEQTSVIASLRELDETVTTYADPAPPADKIDPYHCSAEQLDQLVSASHGDVAEAAQKKLIGFPPLYARELAFQAGSKSPGEALHQLLESPQSPVTYSSLPLDDLRCEPGSDEFILIVSPIELNHLSDQNRVSYPSVNEAADVYFTLLDERRKFTATKQKVASHLTSRIKKQRALVTNLRRELEGFANAETHQRYGELLLANLHQVIKTESGFAVTDFYHEDQPTIEIPSANKATPREAAEYYFKLARKARHGEETINARLPGIERELAQLTASKSALDTITRIEDLNALADEIGLRTTQEQRDKSSSQPTKKSKAEKITGVRRYRSSDGYEILVGRTDRDNDHLTFRIAKSHDLWFHAADYPGSHVVLRNPRRNQVPPRAITETAQLAAKFSQAKGGVKVAVNYCERKFVTKMKGFAPGQVRLSSFKTILVEPHEAGERVF